MPKSIQVSTKLWRRLKIMSAKSERPISEIVEEILEKGLEKAPQTLSKETS